MWVVDEPESATRHPNPPFFGFSFHLSSRFGRGSAVYEALYILSFNIFDIITCFSAVAYYHLLFY